MWVSSGSGDVTVEAWSGAPGHEHADRSAADDHRLGPFARAPRSCSPRSAGPTSARSACSPDDFDASGSTTSPSARWPRPTPRSSAARPPSRGRPTRASCSSATSPTRASTARSTARVAVPCRPPYAISGLAAGAHTLTVGDARPLRHARPDPRGVGVDGRPQPGRARAAAARRTPTATACPTRATTAPRPPTPSQADGDGDGVGDACEVGAPGNLAPITGERVVAKVLSGEVFIKLPATRSLKQTRRCRASCR